MPLKHFEPLAPMTPARAARLARVVPAPPRAVEAVTCNVCGADAKEMPGQRCQLHPDAGHSVKYSGDDPVKVTP